MTDIKAVWCSRRNIEEESGSLILYTQNPYVMMMTWDHSQSSSRRGFVLSPTPSPHLMFPIPIPWKFKQKKTKKIQDFGWQSTNSTSSLSLFYFSRPHPLVYTALRPTPCSWRDGRSNNIPRGKKKIKSIMLYGTCVYSCTHIYCRLDSKLPWHGRTIAHPCMRDLFGCLKEQIEFKMRERECVPARNTRT